MPNYLMVWRIGWERTIGRLYAIWRIGWNLMELESWHVKLDWIDCIRLSISVVARNALWENIPRTRTINAEALIQSAKIEATTTATIISVVNLHPLLWWKFMKVKDSHSLGLQWDERQLVVGWMMLSSNRRRVSVWERARERRPGSSGVPTTAHASKRTNCHNFWHWRRMRIGLFQSCVVFCELFSGTGRVAVASVVFLLLILENVSDACC